jgi:hypothetical protein
MDGLLQQRVLWASIMINNVYKHIHAQTHAHTYTHTVVMRSAYAQTLCSAQIHTHLNSPHTRLACDGIHHVAHKRNRRHLQ